MLLATFRNRLQTVWCLLASWRPCPSPCSSVARGCDLFCGVGRVCTRGRGKSVQISSKPVTHSRLAPGRARTHARVESLASHAASRMPPLSHTIESNPCSPPVPEWPSRQARPTWLLSSWTCVCSMPSASILVGGSHHSSRRYACVLEGRGGGDRREERGGGRECVCERGGVNVPPFAWDVS